MTIEDRILVCASTAVGLAEEGRTNPRLKAALRPCLPLMKYIAITDGAPLESLVARLEHSLERAFSYAGSNPQIQ